MHRKSENNEFDIVTEAEAVLAAYSERCKIYAKKSQKRQRAFGRCAARWVAFAFIFVFVIALLIQLF